MNIIKIKNATFYAYHGALKEEQSIGGKFSVDVEMHTDFKEAAERDDLSKTINYHKVYEYINEIVHSKKYYLIETLSTVIAESLLKRFERIDKVVVRVRKNNVPIGGVLDYVEAEVVKVRDA